MSKEIVIRKSHARRFLLAHLHLWPPRKLRGKQGALDYIRHVNCIQYDPINVVGQNPQLVLQSRVRNYKPAMLNALLYEDRKLVDGFDKQMSIYPVEDWPCFAYYRERMLQRYMESEHTAAAVRLVEPARQQIEARGPLSSLELEEDTRMDWWLRGRCVLFASPRYSLVRWPDARPSPCGNATIFRAHQRVLPSELMKVCPPHGSRADYLEWHVFRRAGGLGLVDMRVTAKFGGLIGWQDGRIKPAIVRLAEKGQLVPVTIEELPRQRLFIRSDDVPARQRPPKPTPARRGLP